MFFRQSTSKLVKQGKKEFGLNCRNWQKSRSGRSAGYVCALPRGDGSNPSRDKAFLVISVGLAVPV